MSTNLSWLAVLMATDAPALPAPWVMQLGLSMGWALVLALLGAGLTWRLSLNVRRVTALVFGAWTLVPGPFSPDYWLGLAFHAPSLTATLLCGWGLQRLLFAVSGSLSAVQPGFLRAQSPTWLLMVLPVLLGYALLLDTFAVLPLPLYVWGFSPALLIIMLVLGLLPWMGRGRIESGVISGRWIAPGALLLFVITRLPTGNLWDALMDPWLWLILQWLLVRGLYRQWRAR